MPDSEEINKLDTEIEPEDEFEGLDPVENPLYQDSIVATELNNSPDIPSGKSSRKKIWVTVLCSVGLYLLVGTCLILMHQPGEPVVKGQAVYRFVIPKTPPMVFDAFLIPLRKSDSFAYMTIAMNFTVKEENLQEEMTQKKTELRGIIYNLLSKEMNHTETIPSLKTLKRLILQEVNRFLSTGKIDGIYVEQYLAV